ncbi:hypothetical protein O5O45_12115 [Hahella aquimaris]|uniref:tyrosine-protein kinase family protein n=1 Tax=Hahella sp. HNIBRBA332 TaxID=3015983 RepID=UPI00273C1C80|nr:hypothetical protein [Hahella sp. HNIBRBA332]WLQ16665.1 hypothetical protein O5O45_12115 [Hahella sp. HNIBRBA332]
MPAIENFVEIEHVYAQTLGKGLRTLAVAAVNSGDGCSTLAYALARRHSASGRQTLLVDMNLFRPSADIRFQLPRAAWSLDNGSSRSAIAQAGQNMQVLTATLNSSIGFRDTGLIRKVIQDWESHVDAIVFDTSPLKAVNHQNIPAELICAASQACVLIVKSGVTTEADLEHACHKLKSHDARILGAVMNDIENPGLAAELKREISRLARRFPHFAARLRRWVQSSRFLNLPL